MPSCSRHLNVTCLGDDLYDCQPVCEAMLAAGCNFLLTCKSDSHKTLYEYVEKASSNTVKTVVVAWRKGKKKYTDTYRFINKVPIRDSKNALQVNWCELVATNSAGNRVYKKAFVTDHLMSEENISEFVEAGRARWK